MKSASAFREKALDSETNKSTKLATVRERLFIALNWIWAWRLRELALIGAAALLAYYGPTFMFGPFVATDAATRGDFVQTVVASGNVEAPFRVSVGSHSLGTVVDVPVAEGQTVKAGDTLILLDDREARGAVALAKAVVAQSEARMRQMKELTLPSATASLTQAQATLVDAQATYDRAAKLASSGYGTRVALDSAKKAIDIAKAQVRAAQFQVFTDTPGGSDYVMAETQLEQAKGSLATAQSQLSYTIITAPRDGILISRNVERGNIVQPTAVLMTLSPDGDTQLVVQIDEKNLGLLALKQKAIASADAFPKEKMAAEVVYINPGVDLQRASVEVKLEVPKPPAYLRQDMTVSVDIEVARHTGVIVIPTASTRDVASGKPWVMKVSGGRATHQPVKLGLVSAGRAEVLEGLQEGDLVLPASASTKAGAKVRAQTLKPPTP